MQYELVAQGNANILYRRSDGVCIRVSKNGSDPEVLAKYWNEFWRPKLGEFMGDVDAVDDPRFGRVLQVTEIGPIIGEFKPKWLAQSPEAPHNALSCRTCAVKTMRGQKLGWCSLDLAHRENLLQLAQSIDVEPKHVRTFVHTLETSSLLLQLTDWQTRLAGADLCGCMSVRDCTVLVDTNAKLWIVDLDPKLYKDKWQIIEQQLQPYYIQWSSVCRLSR